MAPGGTIGAPGTREEPFGSITRAQAAAAPGDTIWVRGGTYRMTGDDIDRKRRIWVQVTLLDKSGLPGRPIRYRAVSGERPVFDFSAVKPAGLRVHAFAVTGSWIHLEGLEVTGVQVTMTGHTQSVCFANTDSQNRFERLSMHDGMGIGFYLTRGSGNLVLNCDAWNNHDPVSGDRRGGNVDGFGCHPGRGDTGNVFRGCRAWFNSDDGYDCISSAEVVRFENCWAFHNGYAPGFRSLGDGNGFKAGGYGATGSGRLPSVIPSHVVTGCLAVRNKKNGFYANHHPGGGDWDHNTACRNHANFKMLCRDPENRRDVPGHGHVLKHNLGFMGRPELSNIDEAACELVGKMMGRSVDLVAEFHVIAVAVVVGIVEIDFADAFLVPDGLDVSADVLADRDAIGDGLHQDILMGTVGGLESDVAEFEEAQDEGTVDGGVLDPVELDFVDVLVEDPLVEAHALGGELVDPATDFEEFPDGPAERDDGKGGQGDERREDGPDDDGRD